MRFWLKTSPTDLRVRDFSAASDLVRFMAKTSPDALILLRVGEYSLVPRSIGLLLHSIILYSAGRTQFRFELLPDIRDSQSIYIASVLHFKLLQFRIASIIIDKKVPFKYILCYSL